MKFHYREALTPVLLMKLLQSRLQRDVRTWVSIMFILMSLKTEIAKFVKRTKITRAPCRRRKGEAVPRADNFGDLITADHKVLSDNCESRKQSSIRSRGAGSSHPMDPGVSVPKQNFTRNPEKLAKVPGTREETKSHLHWQFLGIRQSLWRSFLESLHVYTTSIGD